MIPILYEKNEAAFKSNGLGRLPDCTRCEVTEERNGIYECEFDYPVTGVNFSEIEIGRIIAVTHGEAGDLQPFDIYRKTEPIDGIVTFYAQHVSYRMNGITLKPFTASSCADVFTKIPGSSIGSNPFSFWTNKAVSSDFKLEEPRTLRSLLAGEEGSILDVYGTGEYEFDKFNVKLYLHRGSDTDVSIRYGKNLSDFESDTDAGDVYTAVVPFWSGTDEDDNPVLVTLPEWYISSGEIAPGGREIIVPLDLSEAFEEAPTVSDLRDKAASRLANSKAWLPVQNISVDFVQLWQTEEYKQFAPLQRLGLCDTCEIVVPMYGYSFRAKVIRAVWNVLLDRYDEMELGDKLTTFADTLVKPVEDAVGKLEKAIRTTKSTIEAALEQGIADAMEQIRGGMGGYIVQTVNAQGQPIELLVTDNLDLTQAVNIWRWNLGGLAHSSHGYNGPYDVAITQDGKINANMILSGTIAASLIAAHSISVSKLTGSIVNGTWEIDLDTGTLTIGEISANKITSGTMSAARINGGVLSLGGLNNSNGTLLIQNTSGAVIGQWTNAGIEATAGKIAGFKIGSGFSFGDIDYPEPYSFLVNQEGLQFSVESEYVYMDKYKTRFGGNHLIMFGMPSISTTWQQIFNLSIIEENFGQGYINCYPLISNFNAMRIALKPERIEIGRSLSVGRDLSVLGTKNRQVKTRTYGDRLLYSYETPTPFFGDIGEGRISDDGTVHIWLDPVFAECIDQDGYQVQLQKYGGGDLYVSERLPGCFVVNGTPGLSFGWEIKAKQIDYSQKRLDPVRNAEFGSCDFGGIAADYIQELREGRLS